MSVWLVITAGLLGLFRVWETGDAATGQGDSEHARAVVEGDLQPIRAAQRLGPTTRQVRRLAMSAACLPQELDEVSVDHPAPGDSPSESTSGNEFSASFVVQGAVGTK